MKKLINKKFATPSKFLRSLFRRRKSIIPAVSTGKLLKPAVSTVELSKPAVSTVELIKPAVSTVELLKPAVSAVESSDKTEMISEDTCIVKEIEALTNQVANLKAVIRDLQMDSDGKEVKLAKLARDKEKLSMDLLKTKRSNVNLSKQLDEERKHYFKEKKTYCHEMNEFKKLKKALSNSNMMTSKVDLEKEVAKLKTNLEQTLQTNYNLSIKFLRMRDSKHHAKNALEKHQQEHAQVVLSLRNKIEKISLQLTEVVKDKFKTAISPSNKKYLQLLNENNLLLYENINLQFEQEQLQRKVRKIKMPQTKSETNARVKPSGNNESKQIMKHKSLHPEHDQASSERTEDIKIIKIFEREVKPGVPTVTILNEKQMESRKKTLNLLDKAVPSERKESRIEMSDLQTSACTSSDCLSVKHKTSK